MRETYTIEYLTERYGAPLLTVDIDMDQFTEDERMDSEIPVQVVLFSMEHTSPQRKDGVISWSRYSKHNDWKANSGERWLIKGLLLSMKKLGLNPKTISF